MNDKFKKIFLKQYENLTENVCKSTVNEYFDCFFQRAKNSPTCDSDTDLNIIFKHISTICMIRIQLKIDEDFKLFSSVNYTNNSFENMALDLFDLFKDLSYEIIKDEISNHLWEIQSEKEKELFSLGVIDENGDIIRQQKQ